MPFVKNSQVLRQSVIIGCYVEFNLMTSTDDRLEYVYKIVSNIVYSYDCAFIPRLLVKQNKYINILK